MLRTASSPSPSASLAYRSDRALSWVVAAACVGSLTISGILIAGWHLFIPDDVYFYLKIADSIYRGQGSTFNGLTLTNGYHPLWLGVTLIVRALAGSDPQAYIRLHLAVCALGNVASIVLSGRLAQQLGLRAHIAPALIALFTAYNFVGSEQHISMPLLLASVLFLTRLDANRVTRARPWFAAGLLLGLTMLARLDNVFAVATLTVAALVTSDRRSIVPRALWLGSGTLLCVAPYLGWNYLYLGNIAPISGAIKVALAVHEGWNPSKLGHQGELLVLAALCAPMLGFWLWRTRAQLVANAFTLGVALHSLYVVFRLEAVWTWYFAGEVIVLGLTLERLAAAAASRTELRAPAWVPALALALALLGVARSKQQTLAHAGRASYLDSAAFIDANASEHEGIALCCSPGAIGFFSHRPIFALDGLTGDYSFHKLAGERGLYGALEQIGVRYVLTLGPRSTELPQLIRATQSRGHGGESVAYAGTIAEDGTASSYAIGLFSPLLARSVGWIRTERDNLVAVDFSARSWSLWRLSKLTHTGESAQLR